MKKMLERFKGICESKGMIAILLGAGIAFRIRQYLFNRALWLDEAVLANYVLERTPLEFLRGSDWYGHEPLGFLCLLKFLTWVLGNSEYVFRLPALVSGCLGLWFARRFYCRYLPGYAALMSLGLFAVSERLIFYSAEAKPYMLDVLMALWIYGWAQKVQDNKNSVAQVSLYAIAGTFVIWFSHASIFVMAGLMACLISDALMKKNGQQLRALSVMAGAWIASFSVYYAVYLKSKLHASLVVLPWAGHFPPLAEAFRDQAALYFRAAAIFFMNPATGLALADLALLIFLVGGVFIFRERRRDFFLLISPAAFVFFASVCGAYPLAGRLLLFLVPMMILFVAEGIERVRTVLCDYGRRGIAFFVLLLFFAQPVLQAQSHFFSPRRVEEMRDALRFLKAEWRTGDRLYVYYGAEPAFRYYTERFGWGPESNDTVIGRNRRKNRMQFFSEIEPLWGSPRVWLLFSHKGVRKGCDEAKLIQDYVKLRGGKLRKMGGGFGALVCLYDLSHPLPPLFSYSRSVSAALAKTAAHSVARTATT